MKKKRLTPKRQAYIDEAWPKWKIYMDALKAAGLYKGLSWSADSWRPKRNIDTKEKFIEELLTNHSINCAFRMELK